MSSGITDIIHTKSTQMYVALSWGKTGEKSRQQNLQFLPMPAHQTSTIQDIYKVFRAQVYEQVCVFLCAFSTCSAASVFMLVHLFWDGWVLSFIIFRWNFRWFCLFCCISSSSQPFEHHHWIAQTLQFAAHAWRQKVWQDKIFQLYAGVKPMQILHIYHRFLLFHSCVDAVRSPFFFETLQPSSKSKEVEVLSLGSWKYGVSFCIVFVGSRF